MKKLYLFISLLLCLQIEAQTIARDWKTKEHYLMYVDNNGKQVRLESTTLHVLSGKVEKMVQAYVDTVTDADTYWVIAKYNGVKQRIKVRLVNVDCPELEFKAKHRPEQPYSVQAKEQVANLIQHKTVSMTYFLKNQYSKPSVDQFGRPLVFISIDNQRLDDIIIYNGLGWYDNSYHTTKPYQHGKDLMELAKKDKAGLWALPDPIKPSDWRKGITSYGKAGQILMSDLDAIQNWVDPSNVENDEESNTKKEIDRLYDMIRDLQIRMIKIENSKTDKTSTLVTF